jgi:hypothetical protein
VTFIAGRKLRSTTPSSNGWHYRDIITVVYRRGIFLKVTNVFIVQVHVHEGAQLAIFGVKLTAQVGMLGYQVRKRISNGCGLYLHVSLFAHVLA